MTMFQFVAPHGGAISLGAWQDVTVRDRQGLVSPESFHWWVIEYFMHLGTGAGFSGVTNDWALISGGCGR